MTAHFYTADSNERNNVIQNLHFSDEGIACYVFSTQVAGSAPLFRAWHPTKTSDDHFYTVDQAEHIRAVQQMGYSEEGVTGYVLAAATGGAVALYRMYGPPKVRPLKVRPRCPQTQAM